MSVVQQLQMQEMNFSLKMEDKYLRQLGGFVDLLHFCIQSLGSMYIIEVLLPPLAVVLLFWFYFSLSYLCLTDILIEIYDFITTPDRLSAQYHFFPFHLAKKLCFCYCHHKTCQLHIAPISSLQHRLSLLAEALCCSAFFLWVVCLSFSVCDWCLTGKSSGGHTDLTALLAAIDSFSLKP